MCKQKVLIIGDNLVSKGSGQADGYLVKCGLVDNSKPVTILQVPLHATLKGSGKYQWRFSYNF